LSGSIWSSMSFDPNVIHAPVRLQVAFRMPIPLVRNEMVTFSLPGFRRSIGSGFFSGGADVDADYRWPLDLSVCACQCVCLCVSAFRDPFWQYILSHTNCFVLRAGSTGIRAQRSYSLPLRATSLPEKQFPWCCLPTPTFTYLRLVSKQTVLSL